MNIGITRLLDNIGMEFEWLLLILVMLGAMLFFAKDFRIGMLMMVLTTGVMFVPLYTGGYNYVPSLVVFFMSVVVLALTLIPSSRRETEVI